MDRSTRLLLALGIVLVTILEQNQVTSQCCHSDWGRCHDGTGATPCCGHRACNIFCCSCKGGCRSGRSLWKRDVTQKTDKFAVHDKNGDGHHDIHEAHEMLLSGSCGNHNGTSVEEFKGIFDKFDKNKDGKLSFDEINER